MVKSVGLPQAVSFDAIQIKDLAVGLINAKLLRFVGLAFILEYQIAAEGIVAARAALGRYLKSGNTGQVADGSGCFLTGAINLNIAQGQVGRV